MLSESESSPTSAVDCETPDEMRIAQVPEVSASAATPLALALTDVPRPTLSQPSNVACVSNVTFACVIGAAFCRCIVSLATAAGASVGENTGLGFMPGPWLEPQA